MRSAIVLHALRLKKVFFGFKDADTKSIMNYAAKAIIVSPLKTIFLLAFLYLLIKSFFAPSPSLAFYGLFKYAELTFIGYFISANIKPEKNLKTLVLVFSASLIFQAILAIAQYLDQSSLNGVFHFVGERKFNSSTPGIANASVNGSLILRPYATFPHPNVLAGFLLTGMIFIFTSLRAREDRLFGYIKFVTLIIGSVALMLTLSRIAIFIWLALVIYLIIKLFRSRFWSNKKIKYLYITLLSALLLFLLFRLPVFSRFMSTTILEKAVIVRQDLADTAFKAIAGSPLYGVGIYHFLPFRGATAPLDGGLISIQPVHNIFLLFASENGLIGLVFFLSIFWFTFLRLTKKQTEFKTNLLLILSVIAVLGTFDHYWLTVQQGQLLMALFIGLSWVL